MNFNPWGIAIAFIGIVLIVLGWRGTYKSAWSMVAGK